jgi:hypothetical protein
MAYTPKQQFGPEEEQEGGFQAPGAPTAPTIAGPALGSTPSVGGTVAGNSAAAPKSQVQGATAGTGFVNIDKYLGANQGEGKRIAGIAGAQRKKDAATFDSGANAFKSGVEGASGPVSFDPANIQGVMSGDSSATELAKNALAQTWGGPNTLETKTGKNSSDDLSRLLSNPLTAGAKLATMSGPQALYNPQMNSLDQAILQAQSGDLSQIAKDQATENERQTGTKSQLEQLAAGKKSSIEAEAAKVRGLFQSQADKVLGGLNATPIGDPGRVYTEAGVNTIKGQEHMLQNLGKLLGDPTLSTMSDFSTKAIQTSPGLSGPLPGQPGGASVAGGTPASQSTSAYATEQRLQQRQNEENEEADRREQQRGGRN